MSGHDWSGVGRPCVGGLLPDLVPPRHSPNRFLDGTANVRMDIDFDEVPLPPYYETIGIEITAVEPGHATGRMPLTPAISASPTAEIAHGGAVASLADSVGYWAVSAANGFATTPTVDLRVDYLAPATDDLTAEASVARNGDSVGVVDVEVRTSETTVAVARGVFKAGGGDGATAWDEPEG